jgi:hypothetical protein
MFQSFHCPILGRIHSPTGSFRRQMFRRQLSHRQGNLGLGKKIRMWIKEFGLGLGLG